MFEVPAAKRVKRIELSGHGSDDEPDSDHAATAEETAIPNYGFEYDFVELKSNITDPAIPIDSAEISDQAFQFNLFRPSTKSKPSTEEGTNTTDTDVKHKERSGSTIEPALISIRSPSPAADPESNTIFYKDPRPDSYYLTSRLPTSKLQELRESYKAAAVSVSELQRLKQRPWPGTSLPWRVMQLPAHRKQIFVHRPTQKDQLSLLTTPAAGNTELTRVHRARPSKRKRDLLRDRAAKRQKIIDESKTKEEHEREKKARKNREQKLKRRAKERQLKEEKRSAVKDSDSAQPGDNAVT